MSTRRPRLAAFAALSLAAGVGGAAGAPAPSDCALIAADAARLACYDSIFRAGGPAPAAAAAATGAAAATPAAPVPARDPAADFGLTAGEIQARQQQQQQAPPPPTSITGTVSKVSRRASGEWVVTLEDGQVWTQIEDNSQSRVAPGDTVTIRKASLGSYLLVGANGVATRVRRVR